MMSFSKHDWMFIAYMVNFEIGNSIYLGPLHEASSTPSAADEILQHQLNLSPTMFPRFDMPI